LSPEDPHNLWTSFWRAGHERYTILAEQTASSRIIFATPTEFPTRSEILQTARPSSGLSSVEIWEYTDLFDQDKGWRQFGGPITLGDNAKNYLEMIAEAVMHGPVGGGRMNIVL
jgi:hypothetical protein